MRRAGLTILIALAFVALATRLGSERDPRSLVDAGPEPSHAPSAGEVDARQEVPEPSPAGEGDVGLDISFTGHCPRSSASLFMAAHDLLAHLAGSPALAPEARLGVEQALASPPTGALPPLLKAREALPGDRDLALATALLRMASFELHEADSLLAEVLQANRGDTQVARLRGHLRARIDRLGPPHEVERNGIALRWFGDALQPGQASRLAEQLDAIREEASRAAGAPSRSRLDVVVYPDLDALHAATCSAQWMGGAFDGARMHLVRTGDALGVDLRIARHETMHAEIRELARDVPVWLNEGMAEWFSSPNPGARLRRWRDLMVKNRTCIPFSSMLATLQDFEAFDADLAYAQSVAMVEYLVAAGGPEAPRRALRFLAQGGDRSRALAEALGRSQVSEDEFLDYLAAHPAQERP